jgi:hypothetical protein
MSLVSLNWLYVNGDSPRDAAVLYAKNGWAVFPCIGKQPLTSTGFKDGTTDVEKVAALWRSNPSANIGWSLPVGWFAVDVDPRHDGDKSLRALEREHGPLPHTLRARTGGGGEHWIYLVPKGVEIRQMAGFRPGLDTRLGGRGYLLIAPSIHPDTKKHYEWAMAVFPTDPPSWLVDILKAPPAPPQVAYTPPVSGRAFDGRERKARAALIGMAKLMANAGDGERNNLLNWCWFKMAGYRDVVSANEIAAELRAAALSAGLPEREIEKVLRQ